MTYSCCLTREPVGCLLFRLKPGNMNMSDRLPDFLNPAGDQILDDRLGSARQLLVGKARRPVGRIAKTATLIFLISFKVAFEPFDMAVAFECQYVSRQTIKEEAVIADNHGAAREVFDGVFKGTQGLDVKIVGRSVK